MWGSAGSFPSVVRLKTHFYTFSCSKTRLVTVVLSLCYSIQITKLGQNMRCVAAGLLSCYVFRGRQTATAAQDGVCTREALSGVSLSHREERRMSSHDLLALSQRVLLVLPRRLDRTQLLTLQPRPWSRKQYSLRFFLDFYSPATVITVPEAFCFRAVRACAIVLKVS